MSADTGSNYNVTPEMVHEVRRVFDGFLLVGGGITNQKTAKTLSTLISCIPFMFND